MTFTKKQKASIELFKQSVLEHPLAIDKQEAVRREGFTWCSDDWTIEVCKFLVQGLKVYEVNTPFHHLQNNPLWTKTIIIRHGEHKMRMLEVLRENMDFADQILICEVGRGLDVVLSSMVKTWKHIDCYDTNENVLKTVRSYFVKIHQLQLTTRIQNSGVVDFSLLTEPVIVIANETMLGEHHFESMRENPKVLPIINGSLYDAQ